MANKTNSKKVIDAIHQHIYDFIDAEDYGCASVGDSLNGQIRYMANPNETPYQTARRFVEGGSFLVYNGDIENEVMVWTDDNRDFPMEKTFELYVHLMAREIVKIAGL